MAGHSHSANIAVRKGKQDASRARVFSKLARYIMIAAKNGGGDPTTNLRLRYAIDKARHVSMPKEKIERAILKGTGELEGETFEEVTYEGYGPGGVAILVEALTDNRARTGGEMRNTFEKLGGNMGAIGCVGYLFDRKGLILIDTKAFPDEDKAMEAALNAGAEDFQRDGDSYAVTTDVAGFGPVLDAMKEAGYVPVEADVKQLPQTYVEVETEVGRKLIRLIDALDANEDVQTVYSNANITAAMVAD
jgi:YebC/PmpR family DNA-binding regulatory protein